VCGIAGIVNLSNKQLDTKKNIKLMTDTIRHRGPDGEGFLFCNESESIPVGGNETPTNVYESNLPFTPKKNIENLSSDYSLAFGHRRLSIIDLSTAGHQPMCSPDKKLWITYNGEIYNYIELREELKVKGYQFYTNTDTEVILNAYIEWGSDCLNKFNGMWAFVIYDRSKSELFGSRDRFGVKPFYYYKDDDVLAFASEQKALVKLPFVKTGINPKAVFDFFVKGEIEYDEEGMFKNILELFPSYAFTFNIKTKELRKWKYYSLAINEQYESFNEVKFNEVSKHTKELLENAIALRLRSDVPVGSCLSGGIDSSTIVGITNYLLSKNGSINVDDKLKVFTASFKDKTYDESHWAKLVVDSTNSQWHQIFPSSSELLKDLENLIYSQDVPIWSTSTYAQYRVMQLAKQSGIKVVLDGQGGDELFAGYDTYNIANWIEVLKNKEWKQLRNESKGNFNLFIRHYLRFYGIKKLSSQTQSSIYKKYFAGIQYLNKDFWNNHKSQLSSEGVFENSLNKTLYNEFYNTRLKGYLKCEDRCSMWHSVESRTPFADDINLIEHVFKLPGTYKIHNNTNKYLLRESAKDFIPAAIKNRKDKMGYVTPNNQWIAEMKDSLKDLFDDKLKEYVNINLLQKDYDNFFSLTGKVDTGRIFKFISFAQWVKNFNL